MRPIPEAQVQLVSKLTARYPWGPRSRWQSETIGIADLTRPDYGDPVAIHRDEVPVFWACGVTPQAVALEARPELIVTHEPGNHVPDRPASGRGLPGRPMKMGRGGAMTHDYKGQ